LHVLSRSRRPHRPDRWSPDKAVTFIVTLAATGSVTLAARQAQMSRKSAYALKSRDHAFATAWAAASVAARQRPIQGDKVEEVEGPTFPSSQGNMSPLRMERRRAFAAAVAGLRDSSRVADLSLAQ